MILALLLACASVEKATDSDSTTCLPTISEADDSDGDGIVDFFLETTLTDLGDPLTQEFDTDADGVVDGTAVYTYDANGNQVSARYRSADGTFAQATDYTYDEAGNELTAEWDVDGDGTIDVHQTWDYDGAGNVLTYRGEYEATPEDNVTETWTYDALGDMLTYAFADAAGVIQTSEAWTYDDDGDLLTHSSSDGSSEAYAYAASGDNTVVTITFSTGEIDVRTYDSAGLLIAYTWDWEGDGVLEGTVTLAYDADGNLLTETAADGTVLELHTWDADGNMLSADYDYTGDGTIDSTFTWTFDSADRMLSAQVESGGALTSRATWTYTDCE